MHYRVRYSLDFDLKIRSGQVWYLSLLANKNRIIEYFFVFLLALFLLAHLYLSSLVTENRIIEYFLFSF